MSDTGDDQVAAIGRTDSDESLILMTSPLPEAIRFVQETPGDLFDAPNGAALIRENPSFGDSLFYLESPLTYLTIKMHAIARASGVQVLPVHFVSGSVNH